MENVGNFLFILILFSCFSVFVSMRLLGGFLKHILCIFGIWIHFMFILSFPFCFYCFLLCYELTLFSPHGEMRGYISLAYGLEHILVIIRPEQLLFDNLQHEVLLGKKGRLGAAVAVVYAEERVFQLVSERWFLVGDGELIFHVLPAPLAALSRYAHIHAQCGAGRGIGSTGSAAGWRIGIGTAVTVAALGILRSCWNNGCRMPAETGLYGSTTARPGRWHWLLFRLLLLLPLSFLLVQRPPWCFRRFHIYFHTSRRRSFSRRCNDNNTAGIQCWMALTVVVIAGTRWRGGWGGRRRLLLLVGTNDNTGRGGIRIVVNNIVFHTGHILLGAVICCFL